MHALIDADIFLYEFGTAKAEDKEPLSWPLVVSRMDGRIDNILKAVEADSYQLYLTGDGNFRHDVATIQPYKGNRPSEKPFWHRRLFDFLVTHRDAQVVEGMEADDAVGIAQSDALQKTFKNQMGLLFEEKDRSTLRTVICSRDKDLHMIPGWHYTWPAGGQKEKEIWWQDETNALRCFYQQLLTGDTVDNILGLYGVGRNSAAVARIALFDSEQGMYDCVKAEYVKRFGSYWKQFMHENARLLWILRTENVLEIITRLNKLEEKENERNSRKD